MDKIKFYQEVIERVLTEYAQIPYTYGDVKAKLVFDRDHNHYLMIAEGWDGVKRVHGTIIHVELMNGKVWIQQDGTEHGIALDLAEQGIPQSDIVLGFRPQEIRQYTGFAVG